jgi:hypothetical protein
MIVRFGAVVPLPVAAASTVKIVAPIATNQSGLAMFPIHRNRLPDARVESDEQRRLSQTAKATSDRNSRYPLATEHAPCLVGNALWIGLVLHPDRVEFRLHPLHRLLVNQRRAGQAHADRQQRQPRQERHRQDAGAEVAVADLGIGEDRLPQDPDELIPAKHDC